ncbi:MAG: hypothetical protein IKA56_03645, partial [Clostridia bacterium]|nr:hypothetical protein [Clostridia bacterium]
NMLDYYIMSLMGFQVVSLILFCSESISKFQLWFTGVVFACVVLAQPFNCLIYFIYSYAVLFYLVKNKNKAFEQKNYLSPKIWLYITLGILSVAIVFCVFLFSQMSISELIHYLPNLFGGQDHTLPFAETGSTDMFSYYVIVKTLFSYFPLSFVLSILLMAGICLDKNRCNNREIWLYVSSFVAAVMLAEYVFKIFTAITVYLFNPYLLFVLTFVSLMLAEKKNTKLFMIFCTGIVYTVFLGIISQALDYIGVIGLVLSNIALAPACKGLYCELYLNRPKRKYRDINGFLKKTTSAVVVCSIATVVLSGIAIKCFDDPGAIAFGRSSKSADTVLSEGPLKGIAVNSDIEEEYNHILEDLYSIKNEKCEKVLVAALIPWTYFCFDEAPCTFTTWFIPGELDLYSSYYENAEKIPQCIYVPRTSFYWGDDYLNTALRYREFFSEMFDVEIKNGKSGYIMYRNTGVS